MRTRARPRAVVRTDVRTHPAVMAWVAVTGRRDVPESVTVLRERRAPHKAIYLLPRVGEGESGVFAKRASATVILTERRIYEEILPALPLSAPRCYGSCLDGSDGWVFLEDVGDQRYSRADPEHLRLAARWVATLHAGAAVSGSPQGLPDGGPLRYLQQLRAARGKIHACLGRWHFAPAEVEVLVAAVALCDALESGWSHVEAACAGVPSTVLHGDFRPKNAMVRSNGEGLQLFPIDWEMAGWGPPTVDLTRIDLDAYQAVIGAAWPRIDSATVVRLATLGRVLEAVAAVDWECESLRLEGAEYRSEAVATVAVLLERLRMAARAAHVLE